jgi:tetrahydromethanopterin S-methyltransferase subunit F
MAQRHYGIRRAFLIVLGLDAFLLFFLLMASLVMKENTMEKIVLMLFFLLTLVLFLECLLRRVTVMDEGLVIRKLGRRKALLWDEFTRVGYLVLHRKVYLLLTTVKGFFVISNAFEEFPRLVEDIAARVESDRVEQDVRLQAGRCLTGIANIVAAWVAALLMTVMILMKLLPFIVSSS